MKKLIAFFMGTFLLISACQSDSIPRVEIRNEMINARLIMPDTKNGYYMATRFDWSGMIESLEYNGHNFFGKWYDLHDPLIHDAIMGPVEEYSPLDYEKTPPGEEFVKIGVGILKKPEESNFDRFGLYQITDHGKWKLKKKSDHVRFIHTLNHENHSYVYTKTVRLLKGKPVMEITHNLKNTGKQIIETDMYNHNFFVFDNQPVGPAFMVKFPFSLGGDQGRGMGSIAELRDNMIIFKRNLQKGETVFCGSITGFTNDPADFDIKVENSNTCSGVRISGDRPLSKLIFWASPTTLCPETYVDIKIEPGKDFTWDFYYEFYTFDIQK